MLEFTFWKVSPKGKTFTLIRVPLITVAVITVVIITGRAVVVVIAVGVAAAVVMAPGKGSGKNLKKSSPQKKGGIPLRAFNTKRSTNGGNKRTP